MNKLIVIGFTGIRKAYLNISREEAIEKYRKENDAEENIENIYNEFEFSDEFNVYDAWEE